MELFKKIIISILIIISLNFIIYFYPSYNLFKLTNFQSERISTDNKSNAFFQACQIFQGDVDTQYKENAGNILNIFNTTLKEKNIAYNQSIIYYQVIITVMLFIVSLIKLKKKKKHMGLTLLFTSIVSMAILSMNILQLYLSLNMIV
jgi:hypothetical protein